MKYTVHVKSVGSTLCALPKQEIFLSQATDSQAQARNPPNALHRAMHGVACSSKIGNFLVASRPIAAFQKGLSHRLKTPATCMTQTPVILKNHPTDSNMASSPYAPRRPEHTPMHGARSHTSFIFRCDAVKKRGSCMILKDFAAIQHEGAVQMTLRCQWSVPA